MLFNLVTAFGSLFRRDSTTQSSAGSEGFEVAAQSHA